MPSLSSGEILQLWLDPQDSVSVANATVTGPTGPVVVTGAQTFGPYDDGASIRIVAGASCSYTVSNRNEASDQGLTTSELAALRATMPGGPTPTPALSSIGEAVSKGWRMSAPVMQTPGAYVPQSPLVAYLREIWEYNRALLNPFNNYQANIGTVVYVDPQAATNGAGTLASPRNILPGFADSQTILLKEGSVSPPIAMGPRTNWLLGTYDARTGGRVFDPDRLAIVDGAGGFAVNLTGAQANVWVSGVKVRNYTTGILKGRSAGSSGGGVEFCVSGEPVAGPFRGFIQNFVRGATLRFNVCHGAQADGLWHGECLNTTGDTLFYGNDIVLPGGDSDGPDCLQFNFLASEACGAVTAHTNWLDNSASNRKQIVIGGYVGPKQVGDSIDFYQNMCIGADPALPKVGGSAVSQNGVYLSIPNANVHENVVMNSRYPIILQHGTPSVVDGGRIVGNLVIVDTAGEIAAAIEATGSVAGPQMVIEKNTIVGVRCGGIDSGEGMPPAIKSYAAASIKSNLILGAFWLNGIRVKNADAGGQLATTNNAFDSRMESFYFDNAAGARAVNAADWSGAENWVDAWWRPLLGSALETEGTAWPGGAVADVYRHDAAGVDQIGALHPARVA